jgi:transposase InsO family protein
MALTRKMSFGVDVARRGGDRSVLAVLDLATGEMTTADWPREIDDQADVLAVHVRRRTGSGQIVLYADAGSEWTRLRARLLLAGIDLRLNDLGQQRRNGRMERALWRAGLGGTGNPIDDFKRLMSGKAGD